MVRLVVLKESSPLLVKKSEMEDEVVAVCRCGLSAEWPLCDGSHAIARDEQQGVLYQYARSGRATKPTRTEAEASQRTEADPRPWTDGHAA